MAANTDKFRKTVAGPITELTGNISATDTVIPMLSTNGYPTDTAIDLCIDRFDPNDNTKFTPEKMEIVTVVIDGNNGVFALRGRGGIAQTHLEGAIVEPSINTVVNHNDLVSGILQVLNQDGTLRSSIIQGVRDSIMPILTADIKDKAVTSEKIGDREVKSINLEYESVLLDHLADRVVTPDKVSPSLIQAGTQNVTGISTAAMSEKSFSVTFPTAFPKAPKVFVSASDIGNVCGEYVVVALASTTGFSGSVGHTGASSSGNSTLQWVAICV